MAFQKVEIFAGYEFSEEVNNRVGKLKAQIYEDDQDFVLGVNRDEYLRHLVDKYRFTPLTIQYDQIFREEKPAEVEVDVRGMPGGAIFYGGGGQVTRPLYRVRIPFEGDSALLRALPSSRLLWTVPVLIDPGMISFDIIDYEGTSDGINRQINDIVKSMQIQEANVAKDVTAFNTSLPVRAGEFFDTRRKELEARVHVSKGISIPVRKRADVPQTFKAPVVRQVIKIARPTVQTKALDPTLDVAIYEGILTVIHDWGRALEKVPSTYLGKGEEDLRDSFLVVLGTHFVGEAGGETFNKAGKTDILLKYDKTNAFVGECKFWGGGVKHLETIDQLLKYLTWRDSKTAIIYFMDTKAMVAPLKAVEEETRKHGCFIRAVRKREESWFEFEFHLPGDKERSVTLTVLCFHLPK
jgi:hypothetical protein